LPSATAADLRASIHAEQPILIGNAQPCFGPFRLFGGGSWCNPGFDLSASTTSLAAR
jgi:hypothetical protein